jgi:ZIP family zinc transporter
VASFFGGIVLIAVIDMLIPSAENPHEVHTEAETAPLHDPDAGGSEPHSRKLLRMGLFTALAITIHNFPEGLATFLAALKDPGVGAAIAVAVALHNIPEGISVSVPIYYATGSRRKAFCYSLLSGLAEPVGAGIAYLALRIFLGGDSGVIPDEVMGVLFGGVAGIMVYISLDELLPTSRAYGKGHDSLYGLVAGMVVMALSLLLMR